MIPANLVAAFALLAGLPASVQSLRPPSAADWRVHLRDGTIVHSSRHPLVAFGVVRAWTPTGVRVIRGRDVDMNASEQQWTEADAWHELDSAPSQGHRVPAFDAIGMDGETVRVETGGGSYTFLEIWAGY